MEVTRPGAASRPEVELGHVRGPGARRTRGLPARQGDARERQDSLQHSRDMPRCIAVSSTGASRKFLIYRTDVSARQFDPEADGPGYVYARLADHIASRIAAGELEPGSRLPGERQLAEEHGVALGTARRALQELRDRGLVVTLPSKGSYVRSPGR